MIDAIHFYKVDDLDNVKRFYGDILRLPLYKDQGVCLIYCLQHHGKIGFCTHHPSKKNDASCITFVYQNKAEVDKMYGYLKSKLDVVNPPKTNNKFHIYHFFVKDFEGHTLEFQTFMKNEDLA